MATTLLGYHRPVSCTKCGYPYLVNASSEAEGQNGFKQEVSASVCPNCAWTNAVRP
jgi:hypothetical protein